MVCTRVWARFVIVADGLSAEVLLATVAGAVGTSLVAGVGAVLVALVLSGTGPIAVPRLESRLQTQQSDWRSRPAVRWNVVSGSFKTIPDHGTAVHLV